MHRISLIVATKDRPNDLQKLLQSLRNQTAGPAEIVIVDASMEPVAAMIAEFPELTLRYLRHWPPSAAAQRNAGILACDPASTLVGFADDDTTFEPQAFENMLNFWRAAEPEILGAAFNFRNVWLSRPHRRGRGHRRAGPALRLDRGAPCGGRRGGSGNSAASVHLEAVAASCAQPLEICLPHGCAPGGISKVSEWGTISSRTGNDPSTSPSASTNNHSREPLWARHSIDSVSPATPLRR